MKAVKLYYICTPSGLHVPVATEIITKAQRMLAFKPTEFAAGLRDTFRAYQKERNAPEPNFDFEEALLGKFLPAKSVRTA